MDMDMFEWGSTVAAAAVDACISRCMGRHYARTAAFRVAAEVGAVETTGRRCNKIATEHANSFLPDKYLWNIDLS